MDAIIPVEKRLISELITMYSLEPELNDIYVEGPSDKCLINRFLKKNDRNVNIVEVDDIDFSELENPDLKCNCKNKIIELSNQLELNFSNSLEKVICIADRDFDDFLNKIVHNTYLNYTDYSSIELYFLNENSINNFFNDILHGFPFETKVVIPRLKSVLNDIFNIKLSLLNIFGVNFEINDYDFKKTININKTNGEINFNPSDYITRYLNTKKLMSHKESIEHMFSEISKERTDLLDLKVRGHDFMYLFFIYIDKIKNHIDISYETLERIAFVAIDLDFLEESKLFQTIKRKYVIT